MYNTAYIPISVDNFTYSISGTRTTIPIGSNIVATERRWPTSSATKTTRARYRQPDVQAFQWANWVDAPLAAGYQGIDVDTMDLTNDWQRCGTTTRITTGYSNTPAIRTILPSRRRFGVGK